jgi:hypothetical protein
MCATLKDFEFPMNYLESWVIFRQADGRLVYKSFSLGTGGRWLVRKREPVRVEEVEGADNHFGRGW